jgi:hypothetical protein
MSHDTQLSGVNSIRYAGVFSLLIHPLEKCPNEEKRLGTKKSIG